MGKTVLAAARKHDMMLTQCCRYIITSAGSQQALCQCMATHQHMNVRHHSRCQRGCVLTRRSLLQV